MGFISESANAESNSGPDLCERYLPIAAKSEGVPLGVLYAVGLTETGVKGRLNAYALNIEGKTIVTHSAAAALREFYQARSRGKKLIDLGCLQVNHHYHGSHFNSPAEMIDPQKNIAYAAHFLKELHDREGNWAAAVALYHASPRKPQEQHLYICTVIRNLIAIGLGGSTPEAASYCKLEKRIAKTVQLPAR